MWTGCRRSCRRKDQSSGAVRHILRSDCQQSSVAPEREERLVDVGPLVIPHAQAAKLTEPGEMCAPRPTAKAASMLRAAHGRQGHDVPNPETVRMAAAPSPRCPSTQSGRCRGRLHALRSGGNRIHQRESFLRVVPVRAGQAPGERYTAPVANQMAAPALGPIGWIRTGLVTAVHARRQQLSPLATNQSVVAREANPGAQSGSDSTPPACCQSRTRRQHVIPDPHASSCGSICHGIPLQRTKTMPVRHARLETRGRPPFGRRGGIGKNGSTRSHNGSESSARAIPVHATSPTRIQCRGFVTRSRG